MKEIEAWVARDKDGTLYLYVEKPRKVDDVWVPIYNSGYSKLRSELFPELQWSDKEPTKVKITIDKQS